MACAGAGRHPCHRGHCGPRSVEHGWRSMWLRRWGLALPAGCGRAPGPWGTRYGRLSWPFPASTALRPLRWPAFVALPWLCCVPAWRWIGVCARCAWRARADHLSQVYRLAVVRTGAWRIARSGRPHHVLVIGAGAGSRRLGGAGWRRRFSDRCCRGCRCGRGGPVGRVGGRRRLRPLTAAGSAFARAHALTGALAAAATVGGVLSALAPAAAAPSAATAAALAPLTAFTAGALAARARICRTGLAAAAWLLFVTRGLVRSLRRVGAR